MPTPVAVLGAGSFGTCLAVQAAQDHDVTIWARDSDMATAIERDRHNPKYLQDIELPPSIHATADLAEALEGRELVICAIPSHGLRDVMSRAGKVMDPEAILVSTVKGIEVETGMLMHQVLADVLAPEFHPRIAVLSGPSFAREVAEHKPTAVTLACRNEAYAISVQSALSCPWFRCYTHDDVIGVEVGGALKNVIAIAVGMCDGLGLGLNARAGLMTRGLREIGKHLAGSAGVRRPGGGRFRAGAGRSGAGIRHGAHIMKTNFNFARRLLERGDSAKNLKRNQGVMKL